MTDESECKSLSATECSFSHPFPFCSFSHPLPFIWRKSLSSPTHTWASTVQPQKHILKSGSNSSLSPSSYVQNSKSTFSCSSMFWFSLYQSSSLSSESHWQLGNLPSLPHRPSFDQSISAHDSKAPLVISGDLDNLYDEKNSEVHMIDFLHFSGDASKIWWPLQCKLCKRHFYRATGATVFVWWTITDHGENPQLEVSLLRLPPLTFWLNVYMLNKVPCKG